MRLKEGIDEEFPAWNDYGINWQLEEEEERNEERNVEEDDNLLWL